MLGFRHIAAAANGEFVLNITSNAINPDIHSMAINAGWNGYSGLLINITAPLIHHLNITSNLSSAASLGLVVSSATRIGGTRGGGTAVIVQANCSITNNGILSGGGGNGGAGAGAYAQYGSDTSTRVNAAGGVGNWGQGFIEGTLTIGSKGSGGSGQYAESDVPVIGGQTRPWARGGAGGDGGSWGSYGDDGGEYSIGGSNNTGGQLTTRFRGGRGGYALQGNSFVNWLATGARIGGVV